MGQCGEFYSEGNNCSDCQVKEHIFSVLTSTGPFNVCFKTHGALDHWNRVFLTCALSAIRLRINQSLQGIPGMVGKVKMLRAWWVILRLTPQEWRLAPVQSQWIQYCSVLKELQGHESHLQLLQVRE